MSGLPPSPPSRTAPIPISPVSASSGGGPHGGGSTSHHVRSLSFSFGTNTAGAPSTSPSSTYSPITPSPILAGMPSSATAAKSSFFSTSPRAPFSKDWAASWASGGIGGGSAVAEDDEDGGPLSMSTSLGGGPGGGGNSGVTRSLGWGGAVVAGGPGNAVVKGGPQTGTRTVVQQSDGTQKMNGVLRRLSLGGGGLMRPNLQPAPATPQTPMPTPQAPAGSHFPPSVTAVPDLIPDRPAAMDPKPRGRKPSVGGKGKRSISPTGERMLQGHHGGLF